MADPGERDDDAESSVRDEREAYEEDSEGVEQRDSEPVDSRRPDEPDQGRTADERWDDTEQSPESAHDVDAPHSQQPPNRPEHQPFDDRPRGTRHESPPRRTEGQPPEGGHQQPPPPQGQPPRSGGPPQGPPRDSPRHHRADRPLTQHAPGPPRQQGYGLPGPPQQHPEQRYQSDPVKETYAGQVDLYDIATWEERTPFDSLAVTVTNGLRASKFVLLIAIAGTLFFGQMLVAGVMIFEEPLLAVLAILSVLPALALAGYFWYGDPTMREPLPLLAATFLLSMLFASFAAVINSTFIPGFEAFGIIGLTVFFFVIVGPIEEFVKWLAIRVYAYQSDTFQTVADGAVYGAVAGLGFAAIENLIYIISVYLEMAPAGGAVQGQFATSVATQRAFVGPGHVIFSAWAGFYLGLAKFNPENRGPIVVKGLLIAAVIHALYNTMVTAVPEFFPLTVGGLFGLILLYHGFWFGLLYRKISTYRELYQGIGQQPPPYR